MWLWFSKVSHWTYTSKFIFNIFRIAVWALHFLSMHSYLQLHILYSIQWFAVFPSGQWFAVCALFFVNCLILFFLELLSLTQPVFVSTYLNQPVYHKFRICILIQFNFINLFNVFVCKYFIIAIGIAIRCLTLLFVTLWPAQVTSSSTKWIIWRILHIWLAGCHCMRIWKIKHQELVSCWKYQK